jgi:hypothetical protein
MEVRRPALGLDILVRTHITLCGELLCIDFPRVARMHAGMAGFPHSNGNSVTDSSQPEPAEGRRKALSSGRERRIYKSKKEKNIDGAS